MTWTLPPQARSEWRLRTEAEIRFRQSLKQSNDARLDELGRILESLEEANGG